MPQPIDACLTIAGSDPSGGAGIQADLKTFAALNVYGCAAITCLTAQNSLGVLSYQPVESDFLYDQIRLVLEDLPLSHIKIGMIGSREAALAIGRALENFSGHITYDPVLKASDGNSLCQTDTLQPIRDHVISKATVITPNLPELEVLAASPCRNSQEAVEQASLLLKQFPQLEAVILTGGHFSEEFTERAGQVTDYIILKSINTSSGKPQIEKACHQRINTKNTHGTGCTFSSAFTAYHLLLDDHKKAFFKAVGFMDQLLAKSASYNTGKGHGGLIHHLFNGDL